MSDGGYFGRIGARVAPAESDSVTLPVTRHLALEPAPADETEMTHEAPSAPPVAAPRNLLDRTAEPPDVPLQFDSAPAVPEAPQPSQTEDPFSPEDPLRDAPLSGPEPPAEIHVQEPVNISDPPEPETHQITPAVPILQESEITEDRTLSDPILNDDEPHSVSALPEAMPKTEEAPAAESPTAPFERYLESVLSEPVPEDPPAEPVVAPPAADLPEAPVPPPAAPRLEIGNIHVEVINPAARAPATATPRKRRLRTPGPPLRHRYGLGPL